MHNPLGGIKKMKMHRKIKLMKVLLFGFIIFNCSCENEIVKSIPEKHSDLSQGEYDKYLGLLNEAYSTNNHYNAAFQLANLKGDKSLAFQLLRLSIKEDKSKCDEIYETYWLYDRHDFRMNILKFDTTQFKKIVELCDELSQDNSYTTFSTSRDEEERQAVENTVKEDTTNFNMKLVGVLKEIHDADQEIRNKISAKNISADLEKKLSKEMQIIDSINLQKIDRIFKEFGYPRRELVGKDGNFTPALVIHHSNALETRYKYLPFLEKAVDDGALNEGTLNMIKTRIEHMELELK